MDDKKYSKEMKIYRARNNGGGVASQWRFDKNNSCIWLEVAPQIGEDKRFDWDKAKLKIKLGEVDIGEIMSVLERRKYFVGYEKKGQQPSLFHKNDRGISLLSFKRGESGFAMRLGVKLDGEDTRWLGHPITEAEAAIMLVLMKRAIEVIYRWM